MNAQQQFFIGIDVSKLHFDAALMAVKDHQKQPVITRRFANSADGLKLFGTWLKEHGTDSKHPENILLVMENTGIYHRLLWGFCSRHNMAVYIGNGAHIKWSLGITRGKDDITDSIRLCHYAFREADTLKAAPALNPAIIRLKDLHTSRSRLLSQLQANKVYLKELKNVSDAATQKVLETAYKTAIEGLSKSIKAIEVQIKALLSSNADLQSNYELLLSVPGIGHVTAVYLLCCTCNFIAKPSGKQLACYAGVAPFGRSSGTSIRGKDKVHKMANKELKKLLYMGAMSVIKGKGEMKAYNERKVKEGKHPLSVINAVKAKILLRVAAVVKSRKPYVDKLKSAA